jgi:hypothetical protein
MEENQSTSSSNSVGVLEYFEKGNKPWFVSPIEIYRVVKHAATSIPKSQEIFEGSINAISVITKYINESTRLNVVVDLNQVYELINKIDSILGEQLVVLDDGLDGLRGKLANSLRQLLNALVSHKNWAEEYLKTNGEKAVNNARTRYEQALDFIQSLVQKAREKYPGFVNPIFVSVEKAQELGNQAASVVTNTTGAIKSYVNQTQEDVKSQIAKTQEGIHATLFGALQLLLKEAQPYVRKTYLIGTPYISKVLGVSEPYIERAKPYVDPLLELATNVGERLKENTTIGPYVNSAISFAKSAIENTEQYVSPQEETAEQKE